MIKVFLSVYRKGTLLVYIKMRYIIERKTHIQILTSLFFSQQEQIFNPLLEVVNNCLQSPLANHTLKRTFGSALDALNGPEMR